MLVEAGMCIKVRSHSGLHLQTLRVRRLYDDKNNTLLYVAYSTRLDGSQNVCPSTCYPSYFVVGDGLQLQSCSPPSCICWCMASHANTSTWLHAVLRQKGGRWGGGSANVLTMPSVRLRQTSELLIKSCGCIEYSHPHDMRCHCGMCMQTSGSRYKTSICALPVAPSVSPAASAPSSQFPATMKQQ